MSVSPGQLFGSYEIVASIGAGGMGEVFRARDTNLKRKVALKFLPQAFLDDQDRLARFRREAEMLAALNHPNIAQVYGLEQAEGQTAIVMELVEGPTLAERIQSGPIPPDEATAIALQVVAALEAAHDKGIVHRDLKPANVKVREDGTVKVLDFGISKPIDPKLISGGSPVLTTPAMTQTGIILGTAAYMSPEQARGRFVDERTDIWAIGCLLYEMLTGQPAFGGEDMMATLARVIDRDTDLTSIPKTISPVVRHTIRLCLQKDPRKRIADIRDVRLALEGRFESESPGPGGAAARAVQPFWRRARVPASAFAAGVALAALAALGVWPEVSAPRISRSIYAVPAELRPALELDSPVLAVAPDGSEFSYASSLGLVRRPLSDLEGRVIQGTGGESTVAPHYSLDLRALFYGVSVGGSPAQLLRIEIGGGTPRQMLPTRPVRGLTPTATGEIYAATEDDHCVIARIPAEGGDPVPIFEDSEIICAEPILLPDGEHLLSTGTTNRGPPDYHVMLHSLATQQTSELFPGIQPALVAARWIVYFDPTRGLSARAFDPSRVDGPAAEIFGQPARLIGDVLQNSLRSVAHYRVSAGGETLVYLRGGAARASSGMLAFLRPDDSLERLEFAAGEYGFPAVSADGKRLALTLGLDPGSIEGQIWVYDLSGDTEPRQLTFDVDGNNILASWAPNDAGLVFTSSRSGSLRLWQQDADGHRPAEELLASAPAVLFPVYAPDGRLGFSRANGVDELDAYTIELPAGEPQLLRGGPGDQIGLDFSPDGKAFAIQSGGELLVQRYPLDGSSPLRIAAIPAALPAWPVWSGDSKRLAFQSGASEITIAEIDTEALTRSSNTRIVPVPLRSRSELRLIDAVPDSEDWLVIIDPLSGQGQQDPGVEIVVVQNFVEELRTWVPPLE